MAIRDHIQRVHKLRGRVTTVDPSQRIVELATADGRAHRVYITDISSAGFVWPQEGEDWSIYEENGMWVLGNKFLNQDEAAEFESLQPGDVYPPRFTVDGTPADGFVPTWDAATQTWIAEATGGGGTGFDASTTTKGVTKLSVAPVTPTDPIAVGDNDPRNSNARTPTGTASGDLAGAYPNPTVAGLHLAADTAINHKLTNVTDPTASQDAATKNYVDNLGTLAQQPAIGARAYLTSGTQSVGAGASAVVLLPSEDYDTDNIHSTTANTSRMTIQTPGIYAVSGTIVNSGTGGFSTCTLRKNGVDIPGVTSGTNDGHDRQTVSTIVNCAAGDYIELVYTNGTSAALTVVQASLAVARVPGNSAVLMGPQAPALAAKVTHNANQSFASGGATNLLAFNTVIRDDAGAWASGANTRLTAQTAGWYDIRASAYCGNGTGTPGYRQLCLRKNGSAFIATTLLDNAAASYDTEQEVAALEYMNPGDYAEVVLFFSGAATTVSTLASGRSPSFSIARVPGAQGQALAVTSTLPSNPVDGQECYYLADATNGVVWHLKYRAGSSSAYKWEFIGGSELWANADGNQSGGGSQTYVDISPTLTLPLAGDYMIGIEGNLFYAGVGFVQCCYRMSGGTTAAANDVDSIGHADGAGNSGTNTPQSSGANIRRKTGLGANTVLTAQAKDSGASATSIRWLSLRAKPVRVG